MTSSGVFDLDGTLVSSARAHLEAWVKAIREMGFSTPQIDVRHLLGRRAHDIAVELVHAISADESLVPVLIRLKTEAFSALAPSIVEPMPCALEIYRAIRRSGGKFIVVTSSLRNSAEEMLKAIGVRPDVLVAGDDVSRGKPDPEPVVLALRRAGLEAHEVFAVGDTLYDLMAFRAAGISRVYLVKGDVKIELDEGQVRALGAIKVETLCDVMSLERLNSDLSLKGPTPKVT